MDEFRYESILDENASLKKALSSTKHILERTINDYETLKQIHEDYKHQYERLRQDNEETNNKYLQIATERKEIEGHFDATIRNFKIAIEQKQKELEDVQNKVILTLDHDMMRIKIINELELPHRHALDSKQAEVDKLQDQVYELKSQNDLLDNKLKLLRSEAENDIKSLKDRHKTEIEDFLLEIQELQDRIDDTKDRDIIRALKRELDDYKIKYEESEQEANELREEKDKLREEKNDILLKLSKQIDNERSDRRLAKTDADKAHIRVRQLEMEIQSLQNKILDREKESQQTIIEMQRLHEEHDQRMKQITGLQQQISTLEEAQVFNQSKWQESITRQQMAIHEKQASEKNRINELQRDLEKYQRMIVDLENKNRNLNFQTLKDVDILRAENQRFNENLHSHERNMQHLEDENKHVKSESNKLHDEIANLQRVNRELQSYKENYQINVNLMNQQAAALAQQQQQNQLQQQQAQEKQTTVVLQRDDTAKNSGLATSLSEALAREQKLKTKVLQLKQKLRKANEKIMELLPYKLGTSVDANEVLNKYRSFTSAVSPDIQQSYSVPGDVDGIKKKYGFTSYDNNLNIKEDFIHSGNLPKKDEYENSLNPARGLLEKYNINANKSSLEYRDEPIRNSFGFNDEPRSAVGFRDESIRTGTGFRNDSSMSRGFIPGEPISAAGYDEIKRFTEGEVSKYKFM